jgi:hypothetical protein
MPAEARGSGGFADLGELSDTWTFDGTSWTQQKPAVAPQARDGAALVYGPALQRLVLFGGQGTAPDGSPEYFADTWTWDGGTWARLTPVASPPGLYEPGATWDPDLGGILVAGGQSTQGSGVFNTVNGAWLFDGVTWTLATGPAPVVPEFPMTPFALAVAAAASLAAGGRRWRLWLRAGDIAP